MRDKEYIERGALLNFLNAIYEECRLNNDGATSDLVFDVIRHAEDLPAADVVEVEKVAEMLRAMFDDDCACNYNGNDEWLPYVCEYGYTECPDAPEDNGCWKQFVKHFLAKTGGEREEQTNEC